MSLLPRFLYFESCSPLFTLCSRFSNDETVNSPSLLNLDTSCARSDSTDRTSVLSHAVPHPPTLPLNTSTFSRISEEMDFSTSTTCTRGSTLLDRPSDLRMAFPGKELRVGRENRKRWERVRWERREGVGETAEVHVVEFSIEFVEYLLFDTVH